VPLAQLVEKSLCAARAKGLRTILRKGPPDALGAPARRKRACTSRPASLRSREKLVTISARRVAIRNACLTAKKRGMVPQFTTGIRGAVRRLEAPR